MDSDEALDFFENGISMNNMTEDLKNTPLVLCKSRKFLIPNVDHYEMHKDIIKNLIESEIRKGGVSIFTIGRICFLTGEAKKRNINSPLKILKDLVPDSNPETLSRVVENLEGICLLLQGMSLVDKPKE